MTATQAPTPGPLSAQQEEAIAFNLCSLHGFDPAFVNTQRGFALAVIKEYERARPRLAPTAPVEASGSERERLARAIDPYAWDDAQYAEPGGKGQQWSQEAARKAADRVLALRPQPSGETRKLLERAAAIADDVERGKRPKLEAVDMIRELRNALLSARPLALGGQQGDA